MNNKKPVDYYDRIADALEIISGDNSHINDEYKNMDYYDRMADALENIAENGEILGGTSVKGLDINQTTNTISLKDKNNEIINNSSATLPSYGLNYDTTTGGLTLMKNGTPIQNQTVNFPNYGSPLTASSTVEMTDTNKVYVNTTDGKWYYYDNNSWEIGGTYNSQGIDTDKMLLVEGAPADAKATGNAIYNIKTQVDDYIIIPQLTINGPTATTYNDGSFELLQGQISNADNTWTGMTSGSNNRHIYIELPVGRPNGFIHIETSSQPAYVAAVTAYGSQAGSNQGDEESDEAISGRLPKYSGPSGTPDWTGLVNVGKNSTRDFAIPSEASGLIVNVYGSSVATAPDVFRIIYPSINGTLINQVNALSPRDNILRKKGLYYSYSDIAQLNQTKGHIGSEGKWLNINDNYKHIIVPVSGGTHLEVVGPNSGTTYLAILKSYTAPNTTKDLINYSTYTGYNARIQLNAKRSYSAIMPPDAQYVAILTTNNNNDVKPQSISVYEGMPKLKCILMGDSISGGTLSYINNGVGDSRIDQPITWAQRVADYNGWDLTNISIGGTGYLDKINSDPPPAEDNYESCGFYIARHQDFTSYDLVLLAYGINDWKGDHPLGTVNDSSEGTPNTVLGAMKATIEAIMTSNPECKIIVLTPLNIYKQNNTIYGNKTTGWARGYTGFSNMPTLDEFANKMIEVCNLYGIQYIDMTRYSVLNSENIEAFLLDGVHPSQKAHQLLARELAKKITF